MQDSITYRLSDKDDIEKIKELLINADLPVADIDESKINFIIAANEKSELAGCIGVERYGADGLLRSFAVASDYRNKGIGHDLLSRLFSLSKEYGIVNLHLLTTTAEQYFKLAGFSSLPREEAPGPIRSTTEFSSLCPSSSTYMSIKTKNLNKV